IVSDYGTTSRDDVRGLSERRPQRYGASLNHAVDFCVLDAAARVGDMELVRTMSPLLATHHAVLQPRGQLSIEVQQAFEALYVLGNGAQDVLDFSTAARRFIDDRDF